MNHAVEARVEVEFVRDMAADWMNNGFLDHIAAFLIPLKDLMELADGDYYEIFSRRTDVNRDINKDDFNRIIAEGDVIKNIQLKLDPLKDLLSQLPSEIKVLLLKQFPGIPFLEKVLKN